MSMLCLKVVATLYQSRGCGWPWVGVVLTGVASCRSGLGCDRTGRHCTQVARSRSMGSRAITKWPGVGFWGAEREEVSRGSEDRQKARRVGGETVLDVDVGLAAARDTSKMELLAWLLLSSATMTTASSPPTKQSLKCCRTKPKQVPFPRYSGRITVGVPQFLPGAIFISRLQPNKPFGREHAACQFLC